MKKPRSTKKSRDKDDRFVAILAFAFLTAAAVMFGFLFWMATPDKPSPEVVSETDAGHVRQASFTHIYFPRGTDTLVETDQGSFLVSGTFTALKGHALVLETRKNGVRMLCDRVEKRCLPLVR